MKSIKIFMTLLVGFLLVIGSVGIASAGDKSKAGKGTASKVKVLVETPGVEDPNNLDINAEKENPIPPVIKEGRYLVPVNSIIDGLNADVTWNDEEKVLSVTTGEGQQIQFDLQNGVAIIGGQEFPLSAIGKGNNARVVINNSYINKLLEVVQFELTAMEITSQVPVFKVGESAEFTVTTKANDDVGELVRAYFTVPEQVTSLQYYEVTNGNWYTLGNVYGPETGFPVANATSLFRATFDTAGAYTVKLEFKTVEDDGVIGSYVMPISVEDANEVI